jgi:hypothetical protein
MFAVSAAWLAPEQAPRKVLERHGLAVGLIPRLQRAHEGLLVDQKQGPPAALTTVLAKIREEETRTDQRHDRKARGVCLVLMGFTELAESDVQAEIIVALRELLFPRGTSIISRTYMEEAGEATLVKDRIQGDPETVLQTLPSLSTRTLLDEVEAWIAAGEKLGQLEASRLAAEAAIASSARSAGPASVNRARMMWIRVVAALVNTVHLDEESDPQIGELILRPLAVAEGKADRRAETRSALQIAAEAMEEEDRTSAFE